MCTVADTGRRARLLLTTSISVVVAVITLAGCSSSSDIDTSRATTSTVRIAPDDALNGDGGVSGGSEATRQPQSAIDKLAASNDVCAVLTQRDVKGMKLDSTTLASTEARKILSAGVVKIYNHLVLIGDAEIKSALQVQRDTFASVLDLVDRYASASSSKQGNEEIRALTEAPQFLAAQQVVTTWIAGHCH